MKEFCFEIAKIDSNGKKHESYVRTKSNHLHGAIRKVFQEKPGWEIVRIVY